MWTARPSSTRVYVAGRHLRATATRAPTWSITCIAQGCIDFAGAVDDVCRHLARARVFALASSQEPLGLATLYAMAARLAVVATGVGGIREVVDDGVTGFLVPPNGDRELVARITQLLTDEKLAAEMGRRGFATASRFSWEQTKDHSQIYDRLLAGAHV